MSSVQTLNFLEFLNLGAYGASKQKDRQLWAPLPYHALEANKSVLVKYKTEVLSIIM